MPISSLFLLVLTILVIVFNLSAVPVPNLAPSISVFAFLIYVFIFQYKNTIEGLKHNNYLTIVFFLLFYFISLSIARGPMLALGYTGNMIMVLSPILLFEIIRKQSRFFIGFILVLVTLYLFLDIRAGIDMIVFLDDRGLKDSILRENEDVFVRNSFALIYSLVIVVPSFITLLENKRYVPQKTWFKYAIKVILIGSVLYFIYFIFRASFTTALVLVLTASLFVILPKRKYAIITAVITIIVLIIVFLLSYDSLINLLKNDPSAERMLVPRLEEIYAVLTGRASEAQDLNARQDLFRSSLAAFFHNPIFGVTWKSISFEYEDVVLGVGHHAEWVDMLARFGLFAFILITFIVRAIKRQYRVIGQYIYLVIYVVLGFLNPIFYFFVNFIAFCYIPLMFQFFDNEKSISDGKCDYTYLQNNGESKKVN